MPDSLRRAIRTLIQLVASGGLVWLTDQLAKDIPSEYVPYMLGLYTIIVALAQNALEDNTSFPALLKSPPSAGQNPTPDNAG